ncbi:M15 family metallopeptidase [Streptomyces californicus]|uniref:M15 family metallopeptidase n=1 Tax=Streptomyces californicus TaxID=67351 RepID=UPI003700D6FB
MTRTTRRKTLPALLVLLTIASCASPSAPEAAPSRPETTRPAPPPDPEADPVVSEVPAAQWNKMVETGMWREGCPATRESLRRVEINHYDFDGEIQRGTLVVADDTADSIVRIFTALFDAEFPLRSMKPVEEFGGDNKASLAADNTAAYNCRRPNQINAPVKASPHANGRAVDINPVENPWIDLRCKCWFPGPEHKERTPGPGKVLQGDPVWQLFADEGWVWQNIKVPDYMHFDTGYPSAPYVQGQTPAPAPSILYEEPSDLPRDPSPSVAPPAKPGTSSPAPSD